MTAARVLVGATLLGLGGTLLAFTSVEPARFWAGWVLWLVFLVTVALGALFLVALEHLVGARWSVPLRRTPERVSSLILLAGPAALIALFALPQLYPWAQAAGLASPIVARKAVWLNVPFFAVRVAVCWLLWVWSYRLFAGGSLRQDTGQDGAFSRRARRFAPLFMAIYAFTITVVAFDWISSLEPEWYSDIFGVYLFAGSFLAGLAATSLLVVHLKERGRLPGVRFDHLYSLGGFLFAFTVFWSYIGFAQYMLIWYANVPEEAIWYQKRLAGGWLPMALVLALLHFFVPFFALIPQDAKGDPRRLRWVAVVVLVAHALDLYWMIFPAVVARPVFGWPEVSAALLFLGLILLWLRRELGRGADVPVGDPHLREALEFRL